MKPSTRTLVLAATLAALTAVTLVPAMVHGQAYSVSFTVVRLPAGVRTQYYLDGVFNGTIQSGETKAPVFPRGGMHTLSVDLYVNVANGTRYQCCQSSPSASYESNLWSFTQAGTHTFTYKAQYRLEVLSSYGSPSGADWYDEGSTTRASVATNMTAGPEGVRYVFVRWEGDASGRTTTSEPILMNGPKKAVATWKTQYILRVSSDPVDMFSPFTQWFDAGYVAEFRAPEGRVGPDTRYVFSEWFGDHTGTGPQASVQMNGPRSVTARYKAQYLLSVTITPQGAEQASGMPNSTWYNAGQSAKLGPVPQIIAVSSAEQLVFISWNVDGMTQQGTSVDVLMDRPHHVELVYRTQYYLSVTSQLGETTGSGWYYGGEKAKFGVTYRGSDFPVKYTLARWQSNPSTMITPVSAAEATVNMDRPYVIEAVWSADYSPMWIFLSVIASAVITVSAIAVVAVMRPGSIGKLASSLKSGLRRHKVRAPGYPPPAPISLVVCQNCGASVPVTAEHCQYCGAIQLRQRPPAPRGLDAVDERVYHYIVKRHGEISLSRASADLGISVEELKNSTERLKRKKRLA